MKTSLMIFMFISLAKTINGEAPTRFFDWNVTYGDVSPLGVKQQVCISIFINFLILTLVYILNSYTSGVAGNIHKRAVSGPTNRLDD